MAAFSGTWVNSYGSKMTLTAGSNETISGVYSSTTGSSGTYSITGFCGKQASADQGIPLGMGIYWHSTDKKDQPDPSWHWTSDFSGQYFPAGPKNPETIEVLNMLNATSKFPGLNDKAPLLWPQTLQFTRMSTEPAAPVAITTSESFLGHGTWSTEDGEHTFILAKNLLNNHVAGKYFNYKDFTPISPEYWAQTSGQFDCYPRDPKAPLEVPAQSVYLVSEFHGRIRSFTGWVPYENKERMFLFSDDLSSTPWGSRYVGSAIDKLVLIRRQ